MKIVCPNCAANYEVPDSVVAAHRPVRCARCNNNWVPGGTADAPAATSEPELAPAAAEEPAPAPAAAVAPEPPPTAMATHETPEFAALMAQFLPGVGVAPTASEVEAELPDEAAPEPFEAEAAAPQLPPPVELKPVARLHVPPPVGPAPMVAPAAPGRPRQPVAAWAASVALLIVLTGASVVLRTPVMKAWPPSTRLYAALGLY